jgi:protein SCO1
MKRQTRRAVLAAALIGLVWSIAMARPVQVAADSGGSATNFPDVTLTTHEGQDVKFYDLIRGRIVAINVIYTNCQYACPIETSRLARMQQLLRDRMGREVFFLSISIDPEHDTPAVLKAYAAKFNAGPGWTFLTGKTADIDRLSKKLGLWSDPTQTRDGHEPMLLVGNEATGQWMRTSALDNPAYTARIMTDWLTSWKAAQPGKRYTDAPAITKRPGDGEYMYRSLCAGCHSVGQGEKIGPDLGRALEAHDRAWLAEYILRPDVLREKKDPIATMLASRYREVRMPNLSLTPGEVQSILGYVETLRSRGGTPAQSTPQAPVPSHGAAAPNGSALVDAALALQAALARDTMVGVPAQAAALRDAATAVRLPDVASAAADLARQTTIADARRAFGVMSDRLIRSLKDAHSPLAAGVRVAYCPMVRKSWLQKDGPLANPYYGGKMLGCGEFTS